ncbi:MAG: transposase [Deltaproteobacteria bacterium]|nr:transposase [Deltaproteobacteria bacterium]MBW2171989.1 transposase [Deltaproteobacteria bacterium]
MRFEPARSSGSKGTNLSAGSQIHFQRQPLLKLLRSDKLKYERVLALQKLDRDPDGVFIELKHHLAWNVTHRRPVFSPSNSCFDFVHDTFLECGDLVGGFASLLWLAPDHIHVYVESDGEKSVEMIVRGLKQFSRNAIATQFPDIGDRDAPGLEIWDEAYFVETAG